MLVIGTLLLVGVSGAYAYGFTGMKNKVKHAAELTEAYDAEQGKDTRQTALRTALRDTREEVLLLDAYFLHYDRFSEFTTYLESLGTETGTVVRPSGTIEGGEGRIGIDLAIEGRFEDVFQAIKLIELLPYKIQVRKIHMSYMGGTAVPSGDATGESSLEEPQWKAIVGFDVLSFVK